MIICWIATAVIITIIIILKWGDDMDDVIAGLMIIFLIFIMIIGLISAVWR